VGNVYVADSGNFTIRQITPAGVVSTLGGTAGNSGHKDGTGTAASFAQPVGIARDSAGNLWVSDNFDNIVRRIAPGAVVTTAAGSLSYAGSP
jgi:sugar lactone lactonase YvrE